MPKRRKTQRFDSEEVQGEDSYVVVSFLTVAETRASRQQRKKAKAEGKVFDAFELGLTVLRAHVHEWNWVDDDGNPLAQMAEHPEVVELLTNPEAAFLGDCILGSEEAAKN